MCHCARARKEAHRLRVASAPNPTATTSTTINRVLSRNLTRLSAMAHAHLSRCKLRTEPTRPRAAGRYGLRAEGGGSPTDLRAEDGPGRLVVIGERVFDRPPRRRPHGAPGGLGDVH